MGWGTGLEIWTLPKEGMKILTSLDGRGAKNLRHDQFFNVSNTKLFMYFGGIWALSFLVKGGVFQTHPQGDTNFRRSIIQLDS